MAKSDFDIPSNMPIAGSDMITMSWLYWCQRIQSIVTRQSWQNMLSQRALGVTYTNGTGRPIKINVRATSTAAASIGITFGSGAVLYGQGQGTVGINGSAYAEIPNGETYTVQVSGGTGTLSSWVELR